MCFGSGSYRVAAGDSAACSSRLGLGCSDCEFGGDTSGRGSELPPGATAPNTMESAAPRDRSRFMLEARLSSRPIRLDAQQVRKSNRWRSATDSAVTVRHYSTRSWASASSRSSRCTERCVVEMFAWSNRRRAFRSTFVNSSSFAPSRFGGRGGGRRSAYRPERSHPQDRKCGRWRHWSG